MILFHLSHTDLDGYGCQLISKKIFQDGYYYNANYGLEVKSNIEIILENIASLDKKEEILLLITDLNLTSDEAKNLHKNIETLKKDKYKISLQLLDHHISGEKCALKYDWYYLDTTRSATKITYEYFIKNYDDFLDLCEPNFDLLIDAINAVDIWLEDQKYFEFGKVCLTMISRAHEINTLLFANQNRDYRLSLLLSCLDYVAIHNGHITLDENIHKLKKEYLKRNNSNNTLDNLSATCLIKMLDDTKEQLTIYYKTHKGLLTYTLGNISIPANKFLKENPDFDFFIDIGKRGSIGLRADNKLDVAKLASLLANGGGHPNAAGGLFKDWKETIKYSEVKEFLQSKLKNLE